MVVAETEAKKTMVEAEEAEERVEEAEEAAEVAMVALIRIQRFTKVPQKEGKSSSSQTISNSVSRMILVQSKSTTSSTALSQESFMKSLRQSEQSTRTFKNVLVLLHSLEINCSLCRIFRYRRRSSSQW